MKNIPQWITELSEEDLNFVKRFVLSSGSLKEMAKIYGVTYPTVRSRLDRVIKQILSSDEKKEDAYISLIKKMVLDESRVDKRLTPQAPHRTVRAPFTHTAPHSNIHF